MPWDLNDPYRAILGDEDDPEAVGIFGPRKLDQYSAEERAQKAMAAQAAHRARVQAREKVQPESDGIYRPPFPRGEDESLTDYGFRLHQALEARNRDELASCVINKTPFRVSSSPTAPLFCSDGCYKKAIKADEKAHRKKKR